MATDFKTALDRERAVRYFSNSQYPQALTLIKRVLAKNKNDLPFLHMAGVCLCRCGRDRQGNEYFEKCLAIQPDSWQVYIEMASAKSVRGDFDEAIALFEKALKINPGCIFAVAGKAQVFERRGDYETLHRLVDPYIRSGAESPNMASIYCNYLKHIKDYEGMVRLARKHLADVRLDGGSRHFLCEQAAKALEKLGRYDEAFVMFKESNDLKAKPFDVKAFIDKTDSYIATFSRKNLQRLPKARNASDLPVFVVSMPRSGSTLTEQIIHAHPRAFGAGEISNISEIISGLQDRLGSLQPFPACLGDFTQAHADELGNAYIQDLREMGGNAIRVSNKHLDNVRNLGMVQLICPGARVVHVKRDPMDNCFSCFMAQLSSIAMPWGTDLRNLGIAYRQYERIMAHWHEVLDIPILDVQYEDLVEDTEGGIRRIIDFCGLEWDDQCLKYYEADRDVLTLSYDQVRQPIYKSAVKRWEKYDAFLGPLREALAEYATSDSVAVAKAS